MERFQELHERAAAELRAASTPLTRGDGQLLRDAAVEALLAASCRQLSDLPAARFTESKWRSLLKRFGVYGAGDAISFPALLQLYSQTLETMRDWFAPPEALRAMRKVARTSPKLKDRYDRFQFYSKDSLGKVYLCRDRASKEQQTCRQIRKDKASFPIDRIRTCLVQLQDLDHAHIPKVIEHLEDFHNFYVISAPLRGSELMDFVQDSYTQAEGLTEARVSSILRQVLQAVAYCHSQPLGPVLHRDLRAECVMISGAERDAPELHGDEACESRPHVCVTGFGLQCLFELPGPGSAMRLGCASSASLGTGPPESLPSCSMPESLAPEVWRLDFGPRCDVWSCGCLMYLLLTGVPPFSQRLPFADLVSAAADTEPDWRLFRHSSTSALSLCRRMLAKDDAERPSAEECLRHPWLADPLITDRTPRELRPEVVSMLVQHHAQAKFLQVLMNVAATELHVKQVRRVQHIISRLDAKGIGYLSPQDLQVGLLEMGVSLQTLDEVTQALAVEDSGKVPYDLFLAGCIDLVDEKLDHMLWKVFAMVDEDHSGDMSVVELAHFIESLRDDGGGEGADAVHDDVEKYLRGVLGPGLAPCEVVAQIAGGRPIATFEEIKRFLIWGAGADVSMGEAGAEEPAGRGMALYAQQSARNDCREGVAV